MSEGYRGMEKRLHEAVQEEGNRVRPGDRLGQLRAATRERRSVAKPFVVALGAAVVAGAVVLAGMVLSPDRTPDAPVADAGTTTVTVYDARQVGDSWWLYPTQVAVEDTGDPLADAVGALITDDQDFDAQNDDRWIGCAYGELEGVTVADGRARVELGDRMDALCDMDQAAASAQDQQLAWTVRDAVGRSVPVTYGDFPQPIVADPAALSPVLITSPAVDAEVDGPLVVEGTGDTFEANVAWQVLAGGEVVADGSTMGGSYGDRKPFSFTVQLPAGTYEVRVYEQDMETGGLRAEDVRTVTVR